MKTEIAVVGGGPGGYFAAIRAAQLGAEVTLVERHKIGGTCLNYGCIPTKALYKNAVAVQEIEKSNQLGIQVDNYQIDFSQMIARKDQVVNKLTGGVKHLLEKNGVQVVQGEATLETANKLIINEAEVAQIEAENIILATGSQPILPPIPGSDLPEVMTSRELLAQPELPDKLAIVGGGVIGVEFASIFGALGCEVTIIEQLPRLLPMMDKELSLSLEEELANQGIEIKTEVRLEEIQKEGDQLKLAVGNDNLAVDRVLLSVGRKPNLPPVGNQVNLATTDKDEIIVNNYLETGLDNVYAIGDVIGNYQLAHVAYKEGEVAVNNILNKPEKMDYKEVPSVVFSLPEVASVGLTEQEARSQGEIKVGKFPYSASGKALAMGESVGFVKVVADAKWNEILGVHILGTEAATLIGEAGLGLKLEATADEIAKTIHAHPTLSELIKEACEDVEGLSIHNL